MRTREWHESMDGIASRIENDGLEILANLENLSKDDEKKVGVERPLVDFIDDQMSDVCKRFSALEHAKNDSSGGVDDPT